MHNNQMMSMIPTHGGKREGAGRPRGSNRYGESTKALRIPLSRLGEVRALLESSGLYRIPLYSCTVRAGSGFPSPADDFIEAHLDLNTHLIPNPASTFFVTAAGDSMLDAGIRCGDMLVVDRSLTASHGKIVIAAINGELTVKRLARQGSKVMLMPENALHEPIDISQEQEVVIWGVVTYVIHQAQ